MMVLIGGDFGRLVGHEGGALMKGIGALIKDAPEGHPSPFYHVRTQKSVN